jgi:hypothetical protein
MTNGHNYMRSTFNTASIRIATSYYKMVICLTVFASRKSNDLSRTLYKQQPVANFSIINTRKPGS